MAERGKRVYIDGTGTVHFTNPNLTERPVEVGIIASVGADRFERDYIADRDWLALTPIIGRALKVAYDYAYRSVFHAKMGNPGLHPAGESYWTGWWNVETRKGVLPTYPGDNRNHYHVQAPYFRLEPGEALQLNDTMSKRPLTEGETAGLVAKPRIERSRIYRYVAQLDVAQFLGRAGTMLDGIRQSSGSFEFDSREMLDWLEKNLLTLASYSHYGNRRFRAASANLGGQMDTLGVGIIRLSQDRSLVRYINEGGKVRTRVLPVPVSLISEFQRIRAKGESPLTESEMERRFKELVNPGTKLFD